MGREPTMRRTPGSVGAAIEPTIEAADLDAKPRQNTPSARSTSTAGKPRDLKPIRRQV